MRERSNSRLEPTLARLSAQGRWADGEEEFFWEPVPGCWSVRSLRVSTDTSPYARFLATSGSEREWFSDEAWDGERRDLWAELTSVHTVAEALAMFREGQERLVHALESLSDEDLESPVMTNWGERWPAWQIFSTMTEHDLHHGAEIGCVRDLYAASRATSR